MCMLYCTTLEPARKQCSDQKSQQNPRRGWHLVGSGQQRGEARRKALHGVVQEPVAVAGRQHAVHDNVATLQHMSTVHGIPVMLVAPCRGRMFAKRTLAV